MEKECLFGVGITNAAKEEILEYILTSLQKKDEQYYIVTPNPEILIYAAKHDAFKTILNNARLALPDGIGVIIASKILGKPFQERVTGVDLMENLCLEVSKKPITVGFLGGRENVAERTAECLKSKYPGLKVVFVSEEWGEESKNQLYAKRYTLNADIDILFVAYGFPKQEEFMAAHVGKIPVKIMMGVGGSFDYISGKVPRAPLLIRLIGFEWLFRLIIQPWRLPRQLALFKFILLVLKERLL